MIDYAKIAVKAGNGGDGHVSFLRKRGVPYGLPEGGDGGKGGEVFLVATEDQSTLAQFRYKKFFNAKNGVSGGRNGRTGAEGENLFLEVPVGTLVKDKEENLISDLAEDGQRVLVAKGGKGGRGNQHLRHLVRQRRERGERGLIKVFEKGGEGEEVELILELKVLADVGLVGLPNVGKSTLLSKLTAARPKIADYPFTTLEPNLGVLGYKGKELVIADVPGLIEGASSGKGLGDQFLKHLERTKLLVHLVSLESPRALKDFTTINSELFNYSGQFRKLPMLICLAKADLVDPETIETLQKEFKKTRKKSLVISSVAGQGLEELKKELVKRFR